MLITALLHNVGCNRLVSNEIAIKGCDQHFIKKEKITE